MNIAKLICYIVLVGVFGAYGLAVAHPKIAPGQDCSACHATPPGADRPPDSDASAKPVPLRKSAPPSKPKATSPSPSTLIIKATPPRAHVQVTGTPPRQTPAQQLSDVKKDIPIRAEPVVAVSSTHISDVRHRAHMTCVIAIAAFALILGSFIFLLLRKGQRQ